MSISPGQGHGPAAIPAWSSQAHSARIGQLCGSESDRLPASARLPDSNRDEIRAGLAESGVPQIMIDF